MERMKRGANYAPQALIQTGPPQRFRAVRLLLLYFCLASEEKSLPFEE